MKLDTHGIRFRFWLVFFFLAVGITLFIGALQLGLIRPYYRNSKIESVKSVADEIQKDLFTNEISSYSVNDALRQAVNNNACVVIFNAKGEQIYQADSIGSSCLFQKPMEQSVQDLLSMDSIKVLTDNAEHDFSQNMTNRITGQEMIIYGRLVKANLANYYLFVNSALEPVDSVVTFFTQQYAVYMIAAILLASVLAMYISQKVTNPIVMMNKEAHKLSKADYSAVFNGGSFTETNELANSLNDANTQLAKIDELRRDLMANVSHDIRTPLTNIKAYAEMIKDISGSDPTKRERHLDVILQETDYMNKLINDMTELSRLQSGNFELNISRFDLVKKTKEVLSMLKPLFEEMHIVVETYMPKECYIEADEIKIGQIIANYVNNAIKFSKENSKIIIRILHKDEHTIRLEVEDFGSGIAKEEIPYIWDRYQKSSKTFSRSQTSTGLGLSIVRSIAKAHHAEYGVTSEVGKGSTFYFELEVDHA